LSNTGEQTQVLQSVPISLDVSSEEPEAFFKRLGEVVKGAVEGAASGWNGRTLNVTVNLTINLAQGAGATVTKENDN